MNKERRSGAHEAKRDAVRRPEKAAARSKRPPREKAPRAPREAAARWKIELHAGPGLRSRWHKNRWFLVGTLLAVLVVAVVAVLIVRQGSSGGPEQDLALAREYYARQDYDSALRYLRRAEGKDAGTECLLLMSDCYEAQGNLEKALEILRKLDTSDAAVAERIAAIDRQRRELQEAQQLVVAGLRFDPDTTDLVLDDMGIRDDELPQILQLYALDNLSLMDNDITDVTVLAGLGGLDTLNLSGNRVTDISPLSELTGLRTLYLDGNPVKDFSPLYGLSHLNTLSIKGTGIDKEALAQLSAALPGCAIHSDAAKETANDITIGGVSFKSDVEELDLSGLGIRDIGALADCRNLKWLKLENNAVTDLQALMNLPSLATLDLSGNQISDLRPLMGISTLRSLDVSDNQLMDTAAAGAISGLTSLDLSGNPLVDYSGLGKLKNLQSLKLRNTGVRDADLSCLEGLNVLLSLDLEENEGLTDVAIAQLKSMLPSCTIKYPALVYIAQIGGESYRSDLTELSIHGTELSDLGEFDKLDHLETVSLSGNKISNIYLLQYSPSRDTIRTLDLSDNALEDISPLASLTAIEELDLSNNRISSLQHLLNLGSLKVLRVAGNPLTQEQLDAFREAMPNVQLIAG